MFRMAAPTGFRAAGYETDSHAEPDVHDPSPYQPDADPFDLFDAWMRDATAHEPNDPNAMALATATAMAGPRSA